LLLVPGVASDVVIYSVYNDGFLVTWCDPNAQPQCARTWDRDVAEDIIENPDISKNFKEPEQTRD